MRAQRIRLRVALAGAVLLVAGGGVFAWKILALGLPVLPEQPEGLWQVELQVAARGDGEPAAVRAALPEPSESQLVFGERFSSGRLRLALRDEPTAGRVAVWRGSPSGRFTLGAGFRVQLDREPGEFPQGRVWTNPDALRDAREALTAGLPDDDPAVTALVEGMRDVPEGDPGGWTRSLYAFVRHEVRSGDAHDPLRVLATREGSDEGRERLLATLLRAAGVPARVVHGLELAESRTRERVWCEAWVAGRWWPLSASRGFFGALPPDYVRFRASLAPMVSASGADDLEYGYTALRERLTPREVATLMAPDAGPLRWLSLHRLPAGTQAALRVLLILPVGALVVSVLRNVVGLPSYGTFMPMLIALALRGTGLSMGLLLVGVVLSIGVFGRLLITQLRLLLVPRLSVLLCVVVLTIALLGLAGLEFDERDFFAGILFPIVILTMLVERFSITLAEEGWVQALQRAVASLVIAIAVYPIFRSTSLGTVFFSHPELVLVVMGLLVWLGAYTGYRVSDVVRFRTSLFEPTS